MSIKRVRRLVATVALVLLVPSGASSALADTEAAANAARPAPDHHAAAVKAARHQRRVEDLWLRGQLPTREGARQSHR